MANENEPTIDALAREHQRAEGLTNAIYATILMLAGFGALEGIADSAEELLAEILAAVSVLFIVHLYASWLGSEATHGSALSPGHIASVVRAQAPLIVVVVVPGVILALSAAGAFSLGIAIAASIAYGIAFLFVVSAGLALHHGRPTGIALLYGVGGSVLGAVVVGLELSLH